MTCHITFEPSGKTIEGSAGQRLWDLAIKAGVNIATVCGGIGDCGKCRVLIETGRETLDPLTSIELAHLSEEERRAGYRLACATVVPPAASHLLVRVPPQSEVSAGRLQVESVNVKVRPDPATKKYVVTLREATLEKATSLEGRLLAGLGERGLKHFGLTYSAMLNLASFDRDQNSLTCVVHDDKRVIAVEPGDTTKQCYGFAVDVGTTKLAGFLIDLATGEVEAVASTLNPQISYGEDVMSRVSYSMGGADRLSALQKGVIGGINELIRACCARSGVKPGNVYEVCLVGNTCMSHLVLGISPKSLGFSPYSPVFRNGIETEAGQLGALLQVNSAAIVSVLPNIAGFVGSDNVAAQLAVKMAEPESEKLLLMLAPSAPHLAEELWARTGRPYSIHQQAWPIYDDELAADEMVTVVVQVNGKLRDRLTVAADASEAEIRELALASERVRASLNGRDPAKAVYVPGKLLNLVV